jgi:hypothetical protein
VPAIFAAPLSASAPKEIVAPSINAAPTTVVSKNFGLICFFIEMSPKDFYFAVSFFN